jgi:hypothetical protein
MNAALSSYLLTFAFCFFTVALLLFRALDAASVKGHPSATVLIESLKIFAE